MEGIFLALNLQNAEVFPKNRTLSEIMKSNFFGTFDPNCVTFPSKVA